MTLLIDDRAGSRELVSHPPLCDTAQLTRLRSGDCWIEGNGPKGGVLVGVEVKSVSDLCSSIQSGRLQDVQVRRMVEDYDHRWLLVYGAWRAGIRDQTLQQRVDQDGIGRWFTYPPNSRPLPWRWLEAFLVSLEVGAGFHVKHVYDERHAALWVDALYRWWQKPWEKHQGLAAVNSTGEPPLLPGQDRGEYRRMTVAMKLLDNLGPKRGSAAAKHFQTVEEMVTADEKEWQKVEGFGKVLAKRIVEAVR